MSDTKKLAEILSDRGLCFYHFTDTRNLPSIRISGLLSMQKIREYSIETVPGGNQWSLDADVINGMDRFVHLCFINEHPMEWRARQEKRVSETRFLRIDPSVLMLPGVAITDKVSNKSGVAPQPAEAMLCKLDLEVIYKRLDWKDSGIQSRRKTAKLYEILVPDNIPARLIKNLL